MQQVHQYLQGERDYTLIKGDTGPLVYPAVHVYIYSALYRVTDGGKDILLAQLIFGGLYLGILSVVMACYRQAKVCWEENHDKYFGWHEAQFETFLFRSHHMSFLFWCFRSACIVCSFSDFSTTVLPLGRCSWPSMPTRSGCGPLGASYSRLAWLSR